MSLGCRLDSLLKGMEHGRKMREDISGLLTQYVAFELLSLRWSQ